MALKILRKAVKRFFKYTNSIKSYDQKTVPMQCPGGTEKRGIGTEKRGIWEPRMVALPNATLFGSDATFFGSDATLFGSRCHAFGFLLDTAWEQFFGHNF